MDLKKYIKGLIEQSGLLDFVVSKNKTPRVLFWHGVDYVKNTLIEAESLPVPHFKEQIKYLQSAFEIISIEEYYLRYKKDSFSGKEIVLTFDDGYYNNLSIVAPILYKEKIPFTVFISTDHISNSILFPTSILRLIIWGSNLKTINISELNIFNLDISTKEQKVSLERELSLILKEEEVERVKLIIQQLKENISDSDYYSLVERYPSVKPMSWGDVRELTRYGATIGSHCKYHICCHKKQLDQVLEVQIADSKRIIEDKLNLPCDFFAYPNGNFTEKSNMILEKHKYKMGFSTNKNLSYNKAASLYAMPRIGVPFSLQSLKFILAFYPKKK